MDAGRGSNAKIERIFDDTAREAEQAIRSEGLGDIDGCASARREAGQHLGNVVAVDADVTSIDLDSDKRFIKGDAPCSRARRL